MRRPLSALVLGLSLFSVATAYAKTPAQQAPGGRGAWLVRPVTAVKRFVSNHERPLRRTVALGGLVLTALGIGAAAHELNPLISAPMAVGGANLALLATNSDLGTKAGRTAIGLGVASTLLATATAGLVQLHQWYTDGLALLTGIFSFGTFMGNFHAPGTMMRL
ncbi:MAG: hypothetical protein IT371_09685 [Deltaproteobacteria bacterium]|nr:hypothetical protein [Deltaproteobacteria bacterium]